MKQTREQYVTYYQTDEPNKPDNNKLPITTLMNQTNNMLPITKLMNQNQTIICYLLPN